MASPSPISGMVMILPIKAGNRGLKGNCSGLNQNTAVHTLTIARLGQGSL